ncbi:hypothetical protein [Microbacterium sp. No. 7]|uniref:hypothetical protein n=1 Tax=Microbacterium sp. No. 7 TaxID=1714373 RepID=UPI0006CF866C|nr:hypothetical protein [Microbacterium sp. No. 7]
MNETMRWIDDVRGSDSIREVARRVGMNQGTLNRQLNLGQVTFETARDIAREYRRPVLADLVRLGHLTPADVGVDSLESALRAASEAQLTLEIGRRLGLSPTSTLFDAPIGEAVDKASSIVQARLGAERSPDNESSRESVALAASDDPDWQARQEAEAE